MSGEGDALKGAESQYESEPEQWSEPVSSRRLSQQMREQLQRTAEGAVRDASDSLYINAAVLRDLLHDLRSVEEALQRGAERGESEAIRAWCRLTIAALSEPEEPR